jgi:hypothetical protein
MGKSRTISISRDGIEAGEFTEEAVRRFYEDGIFRPTDQYWHEGMDGWAPLRTFIKPPTPQSNMAAKEIKIEVLEPEPQRKAPKNYTISRSWSVRFKEALKKNRSRWIRMAAFYSITLGTIILAITYLASLSPVPQTQAPVAVISEPYPEQVPPQEGTVFTYPFGKPVSAEMIDPAPIAPLTVNTPSGENYYIKLIDASTLKPVLGFYASGETSVTVKVPLGTYLIHCAFGRTWYGVNYLFGRSTGYSKLDDTSVFTEDDQGISTETITLYPVLNGNLTTSPINESDF